MMQLQYNTRVYQPAVSAQQRIAGITFIAVLHAGAVYALLNAFGFVTIPIPRPPIHGHVIPVDTTDPLSPPPPAPNFPPPPMIDPIVPVIEIAPVAPRPGVITEVPVVEPTPPSVPEKIVATLDPPRPPPIVFTPARALPATHTIPDYPPVSRRLGEQGTLRLKLSIAPDGAVSDAQVEGSSGHTRLDEAAVQWVKAHWRYEPAREGAKAVASTTVAVVTFKLQ